MGKRKVVVKVYAGDRIHKREHVFKKGSKGAFCFDLYPDESGFINPGESKIINTRVKVALPEGYCIRATTKSKQAKNYLCVKAGVFDSDYRDYYFVMLQNETIPGSENANVALYNPDTAVCQVYVEEEVPTEFVYVESADELGETERGTGCMGSTGGCMTVVPQSSFEAKEEQTEVEPIETDKGKEEKKEEEEIEVEKESSEEDSESPVSEDSEEEETQQEVP